MFHFLVLSILLTSKVYDVGAVTLNASLLTQLGFNDQSDYVYVMWRNIDEIDQNAFNGYTNLRDLNLGFNAFSKVDLGVFKELVNLEGLILSDNPLIQLTNSKKIVFPFLRGFYVMGYNLTLDSNVRNAMPNLTLFQGSIISQLKPNQLSVWKNLKSLYITSKSQTSLAKEYFNGLNSLNLLSFSSSNIETMEVHTLLALPNVTSVGFFNNKLRSFEYLQIPEKLTLLNLGCNKMNYFMLSRTMGYLKELHIYNNQFRSFKSMDFTFLANLTYLDLSNNPHAYPYEIAGHMKPLVNLVAVRLNNLSISSVDSNFFKQNTKLMDISLNNNNISVISFNSFSYLKSLYDLDLSENQISVLDNTNLVGHSTLTYLSLQGNQLKKIATGTFNNFSKLNCIDLNNNLISEIDSSAFTGCNNLKVIYLQNNPNLSKSNLQSLCPTAAVDCKVYF